MAEPFYITTAISYPNGAPHIGHAYEAIATDAIARYHRLAGREVFFTTGTDEHGLKMAQAARGRDITPRALANEMSSRFKEMDEFLNISFDRFIRTTDADHYAASQAIWLAMVKRGDIYLGRYEGWYSVRDEAYYGEDELIDGEGGNRLSPQGTPVEWTVEESWFFRLSAYAERLLALYEAQPDFIRPDSRRNEVMSFVRGGLADLSVSRTSFDWGVPVPDSPGHVMYVWVDALTNYLTSTGYPDREGPLAHFWDSGVTHIIGKDIVRFHAVYWPAFLMSAGLPLPKQVFGHGFLLNRGEKMSKSVGNVVDPIEMARTYGVDQLRYFLLREVSFGQDGGYSHDAIVTRSNADLANGLGNLAQRCLSIIAKACGGVVPAPGDEADGLSMICDLAEPLAVAMGDLALHRALELIWEGVAEANRYFAERAPWALRKTDPAAADGVLYRTAEAIRQLAILVRWAIPASADALLDQLGQGTDARDFAALAVPLVRVTACRRHRAYSRVGSTRPERWTSSSAPGNLAGMNDTIDWAIPSVLHSRADDGSEMAFDFDQLDEGRWRRWSPRSRPCPPPNARGIILDVARPGQSDRRRGDGAGRAPGFSFGLNAHAGDADGRAAYLDRRC